MIYCFTHSYHWHIIFIIMTINEFLQGDKFALLAGVELLETGNGYAKARMEIKTGTPQTAVAYAKAALSSL